MIIINPNQNFCRVFQLPEQFPSDYCFGGGIPVTFVMVDWFNPMPQDLFYGDKQVTLQQWEEEHKQPLIEFISKKEYIQKDKTYIVFTSFCDAFYIPAKDIMSETPL